MTPSEIAIKYIGQTEVKGNMGFNDKTFEAKMEKIGFVKSHAWCSYFTELVFREAYPELDQELDKLFSASAVQTFWNFVNAGYLTRSKPALENCLVIWQNQKNGKPHWSGHAGIVTKVIDDETFESVEGNTNDVGGREGYIVARRTRKIREVENGLQVLGFVNVDG